MTVRKHVLFRPVPLKPHVGPRIYTFAEDGSVTADGLYWGNLAFIDPQGSGIERAIFAQWRGELGA
jgi:hypothetical protein